MLNFFLLVSLASAADLSYSNVTKGSKVPFDGVLMTQDALVQLIATQESELKMCQLDKETELALQKNNLETKYDLYASRCEAEKKMNEELIAIRDEQIKKDKTKDIIQRTAFYAGFFLGAATSVGIVYSLNQN